MISVNILDWSLKMLSKEQIDEFHSKGYLVLKDLFTPAECDALMKRCGEFVDDFDFSTHPKSVFSTVSPKRDDYFMASGDKIRFFLEDGVLDEKGNLNRSKHLAINKMGHGFHYLDPIFKNMTFDKRIQNIIKSLEFKKPKIPQSMYIFKQPKIGGVVTPHQDATFLMTKPSKVVGVWIALEDATLENGCLWFIPGSHTKQVTRKMIRNPEGTSPPTIYVGKEEDYDMSKFIPAEVTRGSCVLIHGEVVHKSEQNTSDRSRQIYTFHIYESDQTEWTKENWLQPTDEHPFPLLYTNED
ncbi:phytanoyl-CoA dioxygenase domain-containing protein 1-like isoform X2 [Rhopilema esculentum]|uniref:phytanoyl-CoA dioxygenase domain-containing protein 1-like isoform X2 n=1 Tax=Rhopilema esculentum TaxID=499914 RepID=UPI0031E4222A